MGGSDADGCCGDEACLVNPKMKTGRGRLIVTAVILALGGGSMGGPREAWACHRFSVWSYPYPQRCAVAQDHNWYVEITKIPEPPDSGIRGAGRSSTRKWEGEPLWTILVQRIPVMGE
jgi:hypothetical protein